MSERPRRFSRADFRLFRETPTRWKDNDVFGHVNNVEYYSYFDTAVTGFLLENRILDIHGGTLGCVVVETGCTYFASVAFPDILETAIAVEHLGRSSVRYRIGVFVRGAQETAAQGHFVHVFVERPAQRPTAIPDRVRATLETLAL
jgi:acyl-CoA thioester hydrolase